MAIRRDPPHESDPTVIGEHGLKVKRPTNAAVSLYGSGQVSKNDRIAATHRELWSTSNDLRAPTSTVSLRDELAVHHAQSPSRCGERGG